MLWFSACPRQYFVEPTMQFQLQVICTRLYLELQLVYFSLQKISVSVMESIALNPLSNVPLALSDLRSTLCQFW